MIGIKEIEKYKKLEITPSEVVRCATFCKCDEYEGYFCDCTYEGECYYRDAMTKVLEAAREKEGKNEL